MEDFVSRWNILHPGVECFCFGDNLGSHRQIQVIQKAFEKQVSLCFLVAHTSHWSQPLDNLLFASLKQQVTNITSEHAYLQMVSRTNVFSFIDFVLQDAKKAFTAKTIAKVFKETGLFPFSEKKILQLAKENHLPGGDDAGFTPTSEHEYFVKKMTQQVTLVVEKTVEKASEEGKKIKRVTSTVKKNRGYDPADVMEEEKRIQEEKKTKEKEKKLAKEKKAQERQKKREEQEQKRIEKKREREKKIVERERTLREKEREQKTQECKAGCQKTCRIGRDWWGCEFCDVFWMCSACYKVPSNKGKMTKHERKCKKCTKLNK